MEKFKGIHVGTALKMCRTKKEKLEMMNAIADFHRICMNYIKISALNKPL